MIRIFEEGRAENGNKFVLNKIAENITKINVIVDSTVPTFESKTFHALTYEVSFTEILKMSENYRNMFLF